MNQRSQAPRIAAPPMMRNAPGINVAPHQEEGAIEPIQEVLAAYYTLGIPAVTTFYGTIVSATIAAGATSNELVVKFTENGFICSLAADVVAPQEMATPLSAELARTCCGITVIDGVTRATIMSNGDSEQPLGLSQIIGGSGQRVIPMCRRVAINDQWRVKFTNFTAANGGMRAQATFGFLADPRSIR